MFLIGKKVSEIHLQLYADDTVVFLLLLQSVVLVDKAAALIVLHVACSPAETTVAALTQRYMTATNVLLTNGSDDHLFLVKPDIHICKFVLAFLSVLLFI